MKDCKWVKRNKGLNVERRKKEMHFWRDKQITNEHDKYEIVKRGKIEINKLD